MKRTSSALDWSAHSTGHPVTVTPDQKSDISTAEEPRGWHHLLENHTLAQVKASMNFPFAAFEVARIFDGGALPDDEFCAARLALGILKLDEPKVKLAMSRLKDIAIPIQTAEDAVALLDAINLDPATAFSNIFPHFFLNGVADVEAILPSVTKLLSGNTGISKVRIQISGTGDCHLGRFFIVLSSIDRLRLIIEGDGVMGMNDVGHLLDLVSRNKTMHTLRLDNIPTRAGLDAMPDYFVRLFSLLKAQTQFEEFSCACTTEACQVMLGDLLAESQSIKSLSIRLQPVAAMPGLIAGLERNTSLEKLILDIDSIAPDIWRRENSIGALIYALGKNKSSLNYLQLDLFRCPADTFSSLFNAGVEGRSKRAFIADLLANISRLSTLSLHVPNDICLDLSAIGEGLEENHGLEQLDIRFGRSSSGERKQNGSFDLHTFPGFVKKLAQNRTLVKLTAQDAGGHDSLFHSDAELRNILDRNATFQKYACSRAYVNGAASGFFEALGLPSDPATVLGKHLDAQRPRTSARALALINKACNKRALDARRFANAANLKASVRVPRANLYAFFTEMCEIFKNICVTKQDFSDADLKLIADSNVLAATLVEWMDKHSADYIYLAKRICNAVGPEIIRKKLSTEFPYRHTMTSHRLSMLEQTFQPDQTHLAYLMNKELDYQSIESVEVKFFVGYNVFVKDGFRSHLLMDEVIAWCVKHHCPELYLAYVANFPKTLVKTQTMPNEFRQRFLSKIPSCQKIKRLLLMNVYQEDDSHILEPLLANGSGLNHLHLLNLHCSHRYFDIAMDMISQNTGLTRLNVSLPESQPPFPLVEKIRDTLRNNRALAMLTLKVPAGHIELPSLRQLMDINSRFTVKTEYLDRLSDPGDDGSDDNGQHA